MTAQERAATPRLQDHLDHDLWSTEETRQVRAQAREFAERVIRPVAHQLAHVDESVESFPRNILSQMAAEGLLGIPFAADDGGWGLEHPALATAATIEELAYHSSGIAAIFDVQCILAGHALAQADERLRGLYLRPLLAGELVASFATTEPLASSDLSPNAVQTHAQREGNHLVVNGRKRFITNAPVADIAIVLCRTDEGLTTLVVDLHASGVTVGTPDRKLGNRAQLTADIVLDSVRVPSGHIIGVPGKGLAVALSTLTYGRVGIAASGVGMAQAALDAAVDHLSTRSAFGRQLARFQHWQFLMAERATELENARSLYRKAAVRLDAGVRFPEPEAAMAKWYATRLAVDLARDAVQAFGGYGFMRELGVDGSTYDVEALYRDSKISEIYEGTNEIQKWIIARELFGRDLVG